MRTKMFDANRGMFFFAFVVSLMAPVWGRAEVKKCIGVISPEPTSFGTFTHGQREFLKARCNGALQKTSFGTNPNYKVGHCAASQVHDGCSKINVAAGNSSWTNAGAQPHLSLAKRCAEECLAKLAPRTAKDDERDKKFKEALPILLVAERAFDNARREGIAARNQAVVGQGGDKSPMMERAHRVLNTDRAKYKALMGKMRAFWKDLKTKMKEQRDAIQLLILSLRATVFHRAFIEATVKWATTVDSLIKMTDLATGMLTDLKMVHADVKSVAESVEKGEWNIGNLKENVQEARKKWGEAIKGAKKMGGDASEFVTLLEKIEKSTQTEETGLGSSTQELDGLMEATDKVIDTLKADVKKKWLDPLWDDMREAGGEALKTALKPIMEDIKKLHLSQIPGYLEKVEWKKILANFGRDVKDRVEKVIDKHKTKFKDAVEKYAKENGKWSVKKIGRGLLGLAVLDEVKDVLMKTHRYWAARGVEQLQNNEAELQRAVDDAFATDRNLHIMYRMVNNVVWSLEFNAAVLKKMGLDI